MPPDQQGENQEEPAEKRLSWGTEQRLEFIEFRLFWDGELNRSDITERFAVSVPQASNDIAMYRELAPANLEYDSSAKRYVSTPSLGPVSCGPTQIDTSLNSRLFPTGSSS